jgi:hypothetical protein
LAVAIKYVKEEIETKGIWIGNSVVKGYKGVEKIKEATGAFDAIVPFDSSTTFPWFLDYDRSSVIVNEEAQSIQVKLILFRDFTTDWSEIPIEAEKEIDWLVGYRVYPTHKANSPLARGYADDMKILV